MSLCLNETNREKKIGNIFGATGGNYAGNVYDSDYIAPTLNTCGGGYREPMIIEKDKKTFDKTEEIRYYIVASRGRDPDDPSDRSSGNPNLEQRLEINWSSCTNTITSVAKDNWLLEMHDDIGGS